MTEAEFTAHVGVVLNLIRHHAGRLARGGGGSAEDLVQDALLALWEARHKAAAHPQPSRWFAQAARWRMLRRSRDEARRRAARLDADAHAAADPEPHEFDTLLSLAPPRYRRLLARRFADGDTLDRIAAAEGVTPAAVGGRLETALAHIRRHLAG